MHKSSWDRSCKKGLLLTLLKSGVGLQILGRSTWLNIHGLVESYWVSWQKTSEHQFDAQIWWVRFFWFKSDWDLISGYPTSTQFSSGISWLECPRHDSFPVLWRRHTWDDSQVELVQFGYRSEREVKVFKNCNILMTC